MNMTKRMIAGLLAVMMTGSFASCAAPDDNAPTEKKTIVSTDPPEEEAETFTSATTAAETTTTTTTTTATTTTAKLEPTISEIIDARYDFGDFEMDFEDNAIIKDQADDYALYESNSTTMIVYKNHSFDDLSNKLLSKGDVTLLKTYDDGFTAKSVSETMTLYYDVRFIITDTDTYIIVFGCYYQDAAICQPRYNEWINSIRFKSESAQATAVEEKGWVDDIVEFVCSETMQELKAMAFDLVKTGTQEAAYQIVANKAEDIIDSKLDELKESDSTIAVMVGYGAEWFIKPRIMDTLEGLLSDFWDEQGWAHA